MKNAKFCPRFYLPVPDPGDKPIPEDKELPVRYWSGSDPGDVVEAILFEFVGPTDVGATTPPPAAVGAIWTPGGGPIGDGIIGLPGAEFDLSVLKVVGLITVVEVVATGRIKSELEVLTPVPVPHPPVKKILTSYKNQINRIRGGSKARFCYTH